MLDQGALTSYLADMSQAHEIEAEAARRLDRKRSETYVAPMPRHAYETDFAAWASEQAELIRAGLLEALDLENIAEEIESLSRSDKREILSRMIVLLAHLLKWKFQPDGRSRSWAASVAQARWKIAELVAESPSLRGHPAQVLEKAYAQARKEAQIETGLDLPAVCPWTVDEALADAPD